MTPIQKLLSTVPGIRVLAARPAHRDDPHPVREYINAIKTGLTHKEITVGNGVTLHFRTVAALKKTPGEYILKFTFQHNHDEIPDLELVMYTGLDDMIGLYQARKIRTVSKEKAYKHTAKDEAAVLSSDPHTVCEDIKHKLAVNGELNRLVVDLYKQAIRHLADRHVENETEVPEKLSPFDYGMELRRAFGNTPVHVDAHVTLTLQEITALKDGDDIVVKFKPLLTELTEPVPDLLFMLYMTTDNLTGGVGIRKIRFKSDKKDYTDSDTQHGGSLEMDPVKAAHELREDLEAGPLGDVVREMAMRAVHQLAGGDEAAFHHTEKDDESEDDNRGSGIDWNELGFEDPTL